MAGESILTFETIGDTAVMGRLDAMSPAVAAALEVKVRAYTMKLSSYIQQDKLQGQVLKHQTGKLSRSITPEITEVSEARIAGRVFSAGDVKYAGFWEFGFTGSEEVKAHTRVTSNLFGKVVDSYTQSVSAHTRQVNQAPRSFMRTGLADMAAEIERGLMRTAVKAMRTSDPAADGDL